MSLVRWIRKNNRKIMVFVVIFCMVSFVIGYTGLQIIASVFDPNKKVVARYGDNQKLRRMDVQSATSELTILRMLMAEQVLASQGISGALIAYLLFPDSQISSDIAAQLKQAVQRGQVQISMDELETYFNQPAPLPEISWILLKSEAYRAGFLVSTEQAREILRIVIPQMLQVDAGVVVEQIMNRSNRTQTQIERIFADLLTIVYYANALMDNQAVTISQVKGYLGRSEEGLDAEFVRIDAETFVEKAADVSQEAIQQQFETYKDRVANMPTDQNPYGFGYKLPKRVQVEYMVVLMDDVREQIEAPAAEAMEDYYRNNIQRYQRSVLSDPNDQNSERITQTRPYAEVAPQIRAALINEKANNLANIIFNAVKDQSEAGFEEITFEEATVEQLQMAAGDYPAVAQGVSAEYNVPLITGKTGWLSPSDLNTDDILRSLSLPGQQTSIRLPELLLNISADPQQQTRRIGMPTIRLWQNIGPISGGYFSSEESKYYQLMAMFRVVGVKEAGIPENIDIQYSTRGVTLFDNAGQEEEYFFSLTDQVKEDILLKAAMQTAESRASQLAGMAAESGWETAIKAYNDEDAPGWDPNDPIEGTQAVELSTIQRQTRASQSEIAFARQYIQDNPARAENMKLTLILNTLNNRFYELLPEDAESTGTIHETFEFEPLAACYVVKNVTRQPPTVSDYLQNKATAAMQLSRQDMASVALQHFSPVNIIERMEYELEEPSSEQPAQAPAEAAEVKTEQE